MEVQGHEQVNKGQKLKRRVGGTDQPRPLRRVIRIV